MYISSGLNIYISEKPKISLDLSKAALIVDRFYEPLTLTWKSGFFEKKNNSGGKNGLWFTVELKTPHKAWRS